MTKDTCAQKKTAPYGTASNSLSKLIDRIYLLAVPVGKPKF